MNPNYPNPNCPYYSGQPPPPNAQQPNQQPIYGAYYPQYQPMAQQQATMAPNYAPNPTPVVFQQTPASSSPQVVYTTQAQPAAASPVIIHLERAHEKPPQAETPEAPRNKTAPAPQQQEREANSAQGNNRQRQQPVKAEPAIDQRRIAQIENHLVTIDGQLNLINRQMEQFGNQLKAMQKENDQMRNETKRLQRELDRLRSVEKRSSPARATSPAKETATGGEMLPKILQLLEELQKNMPTAKVEHSPKQTASRSPCLPRSPPVAKQVIPQATKKESKGWVARSTGPLVLPPAQPKVVRQTPAPVVRPEAKAHQKKEESPTPKQAIQTTGVVALLADVKKMLDDSKPKEK